MRKKGILQFLRAKSLRQISKRKSGMVAFVLSAPSAQQLNETREHLRYWPYVKAFRPVDETHMKVLVLVGRGITEANWDFYVTRSCELMNQCVSQEQALFIMANNTSVSFFHKYHQNGFLRPDDLLKPFCDFIDEMN